MSLAFRCDKCKQYYPKGDLDEIDGVSFGNRTTSDIFSPMAVYDLCPDCVKEFKEMFGFLSTKDIKKLNSQKNPIL